MCTRDHADVGANASSPEHQVIFVDMDGTLVLTDCGAETLKLGLWHRPWATCVLLARALWFRRSRARIKAELYVLTRTVFAPERLTFYAPVFAWLIAQQQQGKQVIVVSGSAQALVREVVCEINRRYPKLIAQSYGTTGDINLIGAAKRTFIESQAEHKGYRSFAYVGNSVVDLEPWRAALASGGRALVVNAGRKLRRTLAGVEPAIEVLETLEEAQPT